MKKFNIIIAAGLSLMTLACQQKEDYVIESNPDIFGAYPIAQVVSRDGGSCTLKITGNEAWTLEMESSVAANWCRPDITEGNGAATITFTTDPSTSPANMRNVICHITSGEKTLKAKISQETLLLEDNEVLINGVIWTTTHLAGPGTFAQSPDEIGMYFQFNRKVGYPSTGGVPADWPSTYVNDNTDWLPENDPCPDGYRICTTQEMVNLWETGATWAWKAQTGFSRDGIIVGIAPEVAATANKDNLKALGGLFIPQNGWRMGDGTADRTWLAAVRSGTQLSATHGGMSLGDSGGYRDIWGWGDGQKERASSVRCVRNIVVSE